MSSRKRGAARKIAMLVRMDATRSRMSSSHFVEVLTGKNPAMKYWDTCRVPLGKALTRRGLSDRALKALESAREHRIATGSAA